MDVTVSQIFQVFHNKGILDAMHGDDTTISRIDPVDRCNKDSLVFIDNPSMIEQIISANPAAIVTRNDMIEALSESNATILSCDNVRLAQALIRQEYSDRNHRDIEWPAKHPSAIIHESADIADDVVIGPGVVIGRNVRIGKGSIIMANTVIEQDVYIGEDCILHPNVVISYNCRLENRAMLKSGCVIGMEGFGFAQDAEGKSHRIPQTGTVVIEDDVLFGANCTVDRATFDTTRIGAGSKFDALCHIGHNVQVGKDNIMVTQTSIGGSSTLGNRIMISGQCVVSDHINVCDDVALVQRAGVISDIKKPGVYAGMPTQPMKHYFKNTAVAHKLSELRKQVMKLEKQLKSLLASNLSN